MKYLIIILFFPLVSQANIRDTVPSGAPQLFGGKYYKFNGYTLVDSFIMNAAGDTNNIPRFPALKFKSSDNRWYGHDRTRWQQFLWATDTSDLLATKSDIASISGGLSYLYSSTAPTGSDTSKIWIKTPAVAGVYNVYTYVSNQLQYPWQRFGWLSIDGVFSTKRPITIAMCGQSNAAGIAPGGDTSFMQGIIAFGSPSGDGTSTDYQYEWHQARINQSPFYSSNNNIGFQFAKRLKKNGDADIVRIITTYEGGTSLDSWINGTNAHVLLDTFRNRLTRSGIDTLDAFLWHQGESGGVSGFTVGGYVVDQRVFYDTLCSSLTPGFFRNYTRYIAGGLWEGNTFVNLNRGSPQAAQEGLNYDGNLYTGFASARGLSDIDGVHFSATAIDTFGIRYHAVFKGMPRSTYDEIQPFTWNQTYDQRTEDATVSRFVDYDGGSPPYKQIGAGLDYKIGSSRIFTINSTGQVTVGGFPGYTNTVNKIFQVNGNATISDGAFNLIIGGNWNIPGSPQRNVVVGNYLNNFNAAGGGEESVIIGYNAGYNTNVMPYNSVIIGSDGGLNVNPTAAGHFMTIIGRQAGTNHAGGYSTFIGARSGQNAQGSLLTALGMDAGPSATTAWANSTALGANAKYTGDSMTTIGNAQKKLRLGGVSSNFDFDLTGTPTNGQVFAFNSSNSQFELSSTVEELSNRLDLLENTQWYVDANAGNDLNDGKSAERSVRTIAKLLTLPIEKHDVVNVARGSYFREFLNLSTLDSITIRDYRLGKKPVFDAADIASNSLFTLRSSTTNVYKITWTNAFRDNTDISNYGVWEDGRRLIRQTSIANVDATPGSYYYSGTTQSSGTDTIYVHASNSSNVSTNGRLYEITRRPAGIDVRDGCKVYNMHTMRNGSNNGSVIAQHNSYLQGIVAEDGTKHNLYMASGTAENCVAWKCDSAFAGGTTMFVSFTTSTGADTMDVLYKNCIAIAGKNNDPYISSTIIGIYAHVGAPAPTYRSVTVDGGNYIQCASGVDGEPVTLNVKNANFLKCATAISKSSPIGAVVVEGNTFTACTVCVGSNQPNVYFHHNKINSLGVDKIIQANASDSVSCTYNTVQGGNINAFVQDELATNPALTFKHNIFSNPSGAQAILLATTNVVSTSARLHLDSNLYNNGAYVLADGIKTIANMQAVGKESASSNGYDQSNFYGDLYTNDFFVTKANSAYGFAGSTSTFDSIYRFPYNVFNLPQTIFQSPASVRPKSDLNEDNNVSPIHAMNAQNLYVYKDAYSYNALSLSDSSKRIANTEWVKQLVGIGGYTTTLYTGNGTLASDRTVSTGGFATTWSGANDGETSFTVENTGTTNASGIRGLVTGTTSIGVSGTSSQYIGVFGSSTSNNGVHGQSSSGTGVLGVSSTGAAFRGQINPSSNNAIENIVTLSRTSSSGAGANGLGAAIQYELETATNGTSQIAGSIAFKWTDATNATRTSMFEIHGVNSGTFARKAAVAGNGQWTWDAYGAGTFSVTPATTPVYSSTGVVGERIAPKIYTALISATAGNDPTVTVLGTNEIGTIVWTRTTTGRYVGTLSGAFTSNKTFMIVNRGGDASTGFINPWLMWASANTIELSTLDNVGADVDAFINIPIRIEVYP